MEFSRIGRGFGGTGTNGKDGIGVPVGGLTGQMLVKNSTADYDTKWINVPIGGSGGTSITNAAIDGSGNLILTLSDSNAINAGHVVGVDGSPGMNGTTGVGIQSAIINDAGHLILTLTDSSTIDTGLVKGTAGTTDHSLLINLDYNNSGHTGFQKRILAWNTGTTYSVGDYVKHNGALYYCITAHTSTALLADLTYWETLSSGGTSGSGTITRITIPNAAAGKVVDIAGNMGIVQPRIFIPGADEITVECDFINTDAVKFSIDGVSADLNSSYIWDGTMRPKTEYIPILTVVPASGEACEYAKFTIDFTSFKSVENVVI